MKRPRRNGDIVAAADGALTFSSKTIYGSTNFNQIRIDHGSGMATWYSHAKEGSECKVGQPSQVDPCSDPAAYPPVDVAGCNFGALRLRHHTGVRP